MAEPTWKKDQARKTLEAIAQDVSDFFGIAKPAVFIPEGYSGREWSWQFETVEVWTKAGRAECNVLISSRFAHMYFRFSDPKRAIVFDDAMGRLNRHSGKWNAIASPGNYEKPQDSLDVFRASLRRDFRKVSDPNPPAEDVAAYREKEQKRDAQFAAWINGES